MSNKNDQLNILIIEDNLGDYELLHEYINASELPFKAIFHASRISEATQVIDQRDIGLVLLDLTLPDSTGVDSVKTLNRLLNNKPIIVLSGLSGIDIAREAISAGAQDYLVKGELDERLLEKTVQYSIERKKIVENLKESNQRYEFVNKATMDTIWEYNFKSDTGTWGEGIINVFGYSRNDLHFNNKSWPQLIHPEDIEKINKNLDFIFENKIENWQDEYRFKTASGVYKNVYGRGFIVFDQEDKPDRMYGAITDITERKRLENELLSQKIDRQKLITETSIQAQEKERNELGKELHDNINQMLATVKIFLGMVINNKNAHEELLTTSYKYVIETIEEIRKLSKTLVAPSLGKTDLKQALKDLMAEFRLAKDFEIELLYKVDNNLPFDDKKKLILYRIVQEQLNNIRKHANANRAIVSLTSENSTLNLTISDNGIGFDSTKKAKGIGLKNITSRVEFYSGTVNIVSAPGEGCSIEITIPQ